MTYNTMTKTEKIIANIWSKHLPTNDITPVSNFFEIGGDSLRMINVLLKVNEKFGINVSPRFLHTNSTLRAFSLVVDFALEAQHKPI